MSDAYETARVWLAALPSPDAILDEPGVRIDVEQVHARYVRCPHGSSPVPGVCPDDPRGSFGPGPVHDHWTPYDEPHERVVIRLPAQPKEGHHD